MSPVGFDHHEARFIQFGTGVSAADALTLVIAGPSAGKMWTILHFAYWCNVNETQSLEFYIRRSSLDCPIMNATSYASSASYKVSPMQIGDELILYPGDSLYLVRAAATGGSTMNCHFQYIESDLPYFSYLEPQKKVVQKRSERVTVAGTTGGGTTFGRPGRGGGGEGGGRGGSEPI